VVAIMMEDGDTAEKRYGGGVGWFSSKADSSAKHKGDCSGTYGW